MLLFTALTVLLAYPLSLHPSSLRFPTGPDGEMMIVGDVDDRPGRYHSVSVAPAR